MPAAGSPKQPTPCPLLAAFFPGAGVARDIVAKLTAPAVLLAKSAGSNSEEEHGRNTRLLLAPDGPSPGLLLKPWPTPAVSTAIYFRTPHA